MDDGWSRLRELVDAACALPAVDRAAYLAGACAGDEELRAEAEALVEAATRDDTFLTPPYRHGEGGDLAPGTLVGPYRVLRRIAAGGMGDVYEAEQESPRRRVALKVLRAGAWTPAAERRFQYEAEVLATLRHPAIAPIFETGIHHERARLPWFAMELVEGARTIVEHADDRRLPRDDRVRLMLTVCDAIHHGHQRGVLHRDLKPDNVLVDRDGHVKVIDFGIARATATGHEATLLTRQGEILGTPAFMSPEQLAGDPSAIDVRSDVHALGVLLFRLLTGELPYEVDPTDLFTTARRVREDPPRRPSAFDRSLRGDLETIVLKCLEKEPARRYASAAALGDDLRRFLARQPIDAHPPSVGYQIAMLTRRHRVLVAAAALVFLVSVAATIVSLDFAWRARTSEREAIERRDEADRERERARRAETTAVARSEEAERERQRTRALFDTLLERSVQTTLDFAPRLHDLPGGGPLTLKLIEATLEDLGALEAQGGDDPRVRTELARAYIRLGNVRGNPSYPNLGDPAGATASYDRALEIAEKQRAERPADIGALRLYASALRARAAMSIVAEDYDVALERYQRAEEILSAIREQLPDDEATMGELASTHDQLALIYGRTRDLAASQRHRNREIELFDEMVRRFPDNTDARLHSALARHGLAATLLLEGKLEDAIREHELAAEKLHALLESQPESVPYRMGIAWSEFWIGRCLERLGRFNPAERSYRAALARHLALLEDDPVNAQIPTRLVNDRWTLGGFLLARARANEVDVAGVRARLEGAREQFRAGVDLLDELERTKRLPPAYAGLAGRFRARIAECDEALAER